jgi:hypothetical protein
MSTSQTRVEDGQDNKGQRMRQMAASSEAFARRRQYHRGVGKPRWLAWSGSARLAKVTSRRDSIDE